MYEHIATIIVVAIVLGMDAFSLSMGMGLHGITRKYEIKFVIIVVALHIIMPLLGLSLGVAAGQLLGIWASYIGALILAYIGIEFLRTGYKELKPRTYSFKERQKIWGTPKKMADDSWWAIMLLGISVSMDALTVGFSLGTLQMPILFTVTIMGIVAGAMTVIGFICGRLFSYIVGSYAQITGGAILLGLAVKLVL